MGKREGRDEDQDKFWKVLANLKVKILVNSLYS